MIATFLVGIIMMTGPSPAGVASQHEALQPGISVGGCTLGFALDGDDGRTYFAWAAHCGGVGHSVSSSGVSNFGVVVHTDHYDFSLIRVHPQYDHLVSGEVKGHPGVPTAVTTNQQTGHGHPLQFSGYALGYGAHPLTQENRAGIMTNQANTREYCATALVHWGDSGGPVIHTLTGSALGIVSRLGLNCLTPSSLTGPTIEGGLERAAQAGYHLTLRTA